MTNIEELLERIKALPEIERQELFDGLSDVLYKDKQEHLVDQTFNSQHISQLEGELSTSESEVDYYRNMADRLQTDVNSFEKKIQDIKNIL